MAKLFVGLRIPGHLSQEFNLLRANISGARWEAEENAHITISFIGEVDDERAKKIELALHDVASEQFDLKIDSFGTFSRNGEPNVLWAGITKEAALTNLKKKIDAALQKIGVPFDTREYHPHMTIAFLDKPSMEELNAFLEKNKSIAPKSFDVTEFILYQTAGTKDTPVYKKVAEYPLHPQV